MEIQELTNDIESFDNKLEKHSIKLESIRSSIIKDIKDKSIKLEELDSQISTNNSINRSLIDDSNKLRLEIENHNKKLKYIENIKLDSEKYELIRDKLRLEIENMIKDKDIKLSEMELLKVNKEQQLLLNEEEEEEYNKIKNGISTLSETKSDLDLDIKTLTQNKIKNAQELKILENKILSKEKEHKLLLLEEEKLKESNSKLSDKYIIIDGEINQQESKKMAVMSEIKIFKEEIAEMNEIKDNITHQIDNERKKSRNDENRILALKKEVLNFIISYKDIGDKKKMVEFTRRIENV